VSFQDKLVPQAKFAALAVHSRWHLFLLLGILLLGNLLLELFLLCPGNSRDCQVEILTQPVKNMESKLADPDPPVKETDPRVSQRYRSESPDPDPKRHGSAKLGDLKKK
jgi:hypothetical protein